MLRRRRNRRRAAGTAGSERIVTRNPWGNAMPASSYMNMPTSRRAVGQLDRVMVKAELLEDCRAGWAVVLGIRARVAPAQIGASFIRDEVKVLGRIQAHH